MMLSPASASKLSHSTSSAFPLKTALRKSLSGTSRDGQNLQSSLLGVQLDRSTLRVNSAHFSANRTTLVMAAASLAPVEIIVKGATGSPTRLGDCPFCHRVLLTLEEKKIPYESKLVDLSNKPQWFLDVNPDGKVPVIKYGGKWVPDSDVIVQILDKDFPEPSLETPEELRTIGSQVFPSFVKFLKSNDSSDGTEANLVTELTKLDEHLKHNGPFINGKTISAVDMALAPKLYHLRIALAHFKKWKIPEGLRSVLDYIETIEGRESFKKTSAPEEFVIKGWERHLA